jgi:hypothetical protein
MLVPGAALVALAWLAQAEPAPPPSALPAPAPAPTSAAGDPVEPAPREPVQAVAVHGRFAYRPNDSGSGIPTEGFSLGGTYERRYARVWERVGLGVGLDFFFDRFATDQKNMTSGTDVALYARELMQTSFVALQTLAVERLPVRPFVAAGAGVAFGSGTRPVARGVAGVDLGLARATAITLRADLTHALSNAGTYGDLLDVGVGLLQRF